MKFVRNQAGSVIEFPILVPLVITNMLLVLQLLLLITQRGEIHAIADRIAFLAAAVDESAAAAEAKLQQQTHPEISQISIKLSQLKSEVKVNSSIKLLVPIAAINYQVSATSHREP